MRFTDKLFLLLVLVLGQSQVVFSQEFPPDPGGPITPPGLPIDQGLLAMLVVGCCLGIYIIKKHSVLKKPST